MLFAKILPISCLLLSVILAACGPAEDNKSASSQFDDSFSIAFAENELVLNEGLVVEFSLLSQGEKYLQKIDFDCDSGEFLGLDKSSLTTRIELNGYRYKTPLVSELQQSLCHVTAEFSNGEIHKDTVKITVQPDPSLSFTDGSGLVHNGQLKFVDLNKANIGEISLAAKIDGEFISLASGLGDQVAFMLPPELAVGRHQLTILVEGEERALDFDYQLSNNITDAAAYLDEFMLFFQSQLQTKLESLAASADAKVKQELEKTIEDLDPTKAEYANLTLAEKEYVAQVIYMNIHAQIEFVSINVLAQPKNNIPQSASAQYQAFASGDLLRDCIVNLGKHVGTLGVAAIGAGVIGVGVAFAAQSGGFSLAVGSIIGAAAFGLSVYKWAGSDVMAKAYSACIEPVWTRAFNSIDSSTSSLSVSQNTAEKTFSFDRRSAVRNDTASSAYQVLNVTESEAPGQPELIFYPHTDKQLVVYHYYGVIEEARVKFYQTVTATAKFLNDYNKLLPASVKSKFSDFLKKANQEGKRTLAGRWDLNFGHDIAEPIYWQTIEQDNGKNTISINLKRDLLPQEEVKFSLMIHNKINDKRYFIPSKLVMPGEIVVQDIHLSSYKNVAIKGQLKANFAENYLYDASGDVEYAYRQKGVFEYTPAENFIGRKTFTYQAQVGDLVSSNATVTIDVKPCETLPQISKVELTCDLSKDYFVDVHFKDDSPAGIIIDESNVLIELDGTAKQTQGPWLYIDSAAYVSGGSLGGTYTSSLISGTPHEGVVRIIYDLFPYKTPSRHKHCRPAGSSADYIAAEAAFVYLKNSCGDRSAPTYVPRLGDIRLL